LEQENKTTELRACRLKKEEKGRYTRKKSVGVWWDCVVDVENSTATL